VRGSLLGANRSRKWVMMLFVRTYKEYKKWLIFYWVSRIFLGPRPIRVITLIIPLQFASLRKPASIEVHSVRYAYPCFSNFARWSNCVVFQTNILANLLKSFLIFLLAYGHSISLETCTPWPHTTLSHPLNLVKKVFKQSSLGIYKEPKIENNNSNGLRHRSTP